VGISVCHRKGEVRGEGDKTRHGRRGQELTSAGCLSIEKSLKISMAQQVVHTRSRSGMGLSFVRFLAACYLQYSLQHSTPEKAVESLPPLSILRGAAGTPSI